MASYAAATAGTSNASLSSVIDANHPYFLHNSDNPGTPLVTQLLTEHNYYQWSCAVKVALSAKMKLGLIDGTLICPPVSSPHYVLWSRCNDMVLSWLLNSVSAEIRDSVSYFSIAKEIWDDLSVRFSQTNMPRVFHLRQEFGAL